MQSVDSMQYRGQGRTLADIGKGGEVVGSREGAAISHLVVVPAQGQRCRLLRRQLTGHMLIAHGRPLWIEVCWRRVCESECGTERREMDLHRLQAERSHAMQRWQAGEGCSCDGVENLMRSLLVAQVRLIQSQLLPCLSLQQKGYDDLHGRRLQTLDLNVVQDGARVVGSHEGVPRLGRQRRQVDLVIHLSTPQMSQSNLHGSVRDTRPWPPAPPGRSGRTPVHSAQLRHHPSSS